MSIIIESKSIEVTEDLKTYIEDKISLILAKLKDPTICRVILQDINAHRGGVDKEIRISVSTPDVRTPVFVSDVTEDFYKTVDVVVGKLNRALHKVTR